MSAYGMEFLLALFKTVLIEVPLLFLIIRNFLKIPEKKLPARNIIFFGFIASFATIPYLWFVLRDLVSFGLLTSEAKLIFVLSAEGFVTVVEAFIYRFSLNLSIKRSFAVSFACNASSFLIGLIIQAIF